MISNSQNIAPIELLTKYFANEASIEERKELDAWRMANAVNQKEFDAFEKLWSITGKVTESKEINLDAEWNKIEKSIDPQRKTISLFSRVVSIAASIVVVSTLAFLGLQQMRTTTEKSTVAEASQVTLPDGTIISLNANSKITYSKGFGNKHRNISLKGEAFFEVERNANIPFIISANEAKIEVVGTQFNVKAYKKQPEVNVFVTEGKVQLYESKQPEKKTILTAGESGAYNRVVKTIKKTPISNQNDIAWKTRIIEFNNTPLNEVATVLQNTYQVELIIDSNISECPITVRFENQDIASVLKVLKSTLSLKIEIKKDRVLKISGEGCN